MPLNTCRQLCCVFRGRKNNCDMYSKLSKKGEKEGKYALLKLLVAIKKKFFHSHKTKRLIMSKPVLFLFECDQLDLMYAVKFNVK